MRCFVFCLCSPLKDTLPETNIAPKMDGWNTTFLLGRPIFRGHVSFREGINDAFLVKKSSSQIPFREPFWSDESENWSCQMFVSRDSGFVRKIERIFFAWESKGLKPLPQEKSWPYLGDIFFLKPRPLIGPYYFLEGTLRFPNA